MIKKIEKEINNREIEIYHKDEIPERVFYLNSFERYKSFPFTSVSDNNSAFVIISGLEWNRDLSPWPEKSVFKGDEDFSGGASDYLKILEQEIIPFAEKCTGKSKERIIMGYSLAALFSLWCLYNTDYFTSLISCSASMWFPGFLDYAKSKVLKADLDYAYFSLGNSEAKTRNVILKTVEENTRKVYENFITRKIPSAFVLNEGNHFEDPKGRMEKGILTYINFMNEYKKIH